MSPYLREYELSYGSVPRHKGLIRDMHVGPSRSWEKLPLLVRFVVSATAAFCWEGALAL